MNRYRAMLSATLKPFYECGVQVLGGRAEIEVSFEESSDAKAISYVFDNGVLDAEDMEKMSFKLEREQNGNFIQVYAVSRG